MEVARHVVLQARATRTFHDTEDLMAAACRMLPSDIDQDDVREAIEAVRRGEDDE